MSERRVGNDSRSVDQNLDDLVSAYQAAERRLRESLLGDGEYSSGAVRGEETRLAVGNQLRRLHLAFEEAVLAAKAGQERVDALDAELQARAQRAARSTRKPAATRRTPAKTTAARKAPAKPAAAKETPVRKAPARKPKPAS